MPQPIAGSRPDKPSILAKMSEMRTAGNVPVDINEFVRVAAAAVTEEKRLMSDNVSANVDESGTGKRFVPDRATLLAKMASIRATNDAPIPSDVLVTRAVASLEAETREETASTPIAVVLPSMDRRSVSLPVRTGDLYASMSIAAVSQRKYERSWSKWLTFTSDRGWPSLPAEADKLEAFLVDIANMSGSVAAVDSAIAAVGYFSSLHGLATPFESPRLKRVIQGIHSVCAKRPVPRAPFVAEDIRKMIDKARSTADLCLWRAAASMVLCFNDCARSAEIFDIRVEHLRLEAGRLMFKIGRSKTDKVGYESFVTVSEDPYSPGAFILAFLKLIGLEPGDTGFLSCKMGRAKGIQYARPKEQVSAGTARSGVKALITAVGLDPSKYATHSARRGAAVAAASAGATSAELAELGRWKSADMPLAYIRGSGKVRNAATALVCTDTSACKSREHTTAS
jgi:integrase